MATGNFIPGMYEAPIMAMLKRDMPVLERFAREQRERMEADGYELVDVPESEIVERDAYWVRLMDVIAEGESKDFIHRSDDGGYEKNEPAKRWVKKGSN